jgi:hypothetical protein
MIDAPAAKGHPRHGFFLRSELAASLVGALGASSLR